MDVAMNPIARAIAKQRLRTAIRDFLLTCYLVEHGTDQRENYLAAARVITVALRLCEQSKRTPPSVLRGALSCCEQAARRRFTWHSLDAVAIDSGLTEAREIVGSASAADVQRAWMFVQRLEREAEAAA